MYKLEICHRFENDSFVIWFKYRNLLIQKYEPKKCNLIYEMHMDFNINDQIVEYIKSLGLEIKNYHGCGGYRI